MSTCRHEAIGGGKGGLHILLSLSLLLAGFLTSGGCNLRAQESNENGQQDAEDEQDDAEAGQDRHEAFGERVGERRAMVRRHIAGLDITDPNVLEAMRTVPRHAFMPESQRPSAYQDRPLPIGYGQTISQPYVVAFMTQALHLDPNDVVFEVGTGSGYQAAVAAEIAREVYTIEIVEPLAESAAETLEELGYENVHVRAGDAFFGWPEKAPFDAIIGTAAARRIPPPLLQQLKPGGRMILPVGEGPYLQYLVVVTKDEQGRTHREKVMPVRFVPMTGQVNDVNDESPPEPER